MKVKIGKKAMRNRTRINGRLAVIRVKGDVTDSDAAKAVSDAAQECLKQPAVKAILLDLRQVATSDTKLVAILVQFYRATQSRSVTLFIRPSRRLLSWLAIYRLDAVLIGATAPAPDGKVTVPPRVRTLTTAS
ncbi:MAG: hypothetical protein EA377_02210 [Phycisphaerales bacterium]|nr:MAG: hypothetical protein EA377_02210 [Phycisphaerales bacterium]